MVYSNIADKRQNPVRWCYDSAKCVKVVALVRGTSKRLKEMKGEQSNDAGGWTMASISVVCSIEAVGWLDDANPVGSLQAKRIVKQSCESRCEGQFHNGLGNKSDR